MLIQHVTKTQASLVQASNKQAKTVESIPLQINKDKLTFSVSSDVDVEAMRKMSHNEPSQLANLTTHSIDKLNM